MVNWVDMQSTNVTYLTNGVQEIVRQRVLVPRLKTDWDLTEVAFFGSADIEPEDPLYQEAMAAAQLLAENGKIIVNGGGPGIMEASTRGAAAAGGETLGITFYPEDMPAFEGRDNGNLVDKEIKTTNYIERMMALLSESDVFVCFKGGTGTLSEWSTAWLLAHLYYPNHKPLFLYGDFWEEFLQKAEELFMIGEEERLVYKIVKSKEELLDAIHEQEEIFRQHRAEAGTEEANPDTN